MVDLAFQHEVALSLYYSEIPIHLYDGSKKSDFFDPSDF
jgi:hypothetical protein